MKINKSNKTSVAGVNIFFTIPVYISNLRCDMWLKWSCEAGGGRSSDEARLEQPHTNSTPN